MKDSTRKALEAGRDNLNSAFHALRSYQYGNSSPDLAEGVADNVKKALALIRAELEKDQSNG